MNIDHERYMGLALEMAKAAYDRNEFPVGCVMIHEGAVIARGARRNSRGHNPSELDHAEISALRELEQLGGSVDRGRITMYCTLEPCLMCFGALMIGGIGTVVYAYEDAMGGATACDRGKLPPLYRDHIVRVIGGIRRAESLSLFKSFFSRPDLDYWRGSLLAGYTLAQR
jgi:tRNA(adenine34) deaminase